MDRNISITNTGKQSHGASSFQQAMQAARMLLDAGVEVNVLSVLNDYSIQFPDEIYEFHKVNGLNFMQFIPCVEPDPNDALKIASYSVNSEDYGHFLCRLFDLWMADFSIAGVPKTSIRFFESLLFQYAGFSATECTFLPVCGEYLVVEHNGDVYPCDFFVESKWKAGNILEKPIVELFNARNQTDFGRLKTKLPIDCHICKWKTICHGGCTKDRLHHPSTGNKNYLCKAYKTFFPYADSRLTQLAEEWKKGNEFIN